MPRDDVDVRIRQVGLVKAGTELKVAAILFTYRCTISCRHCLFACGGDRPDVVMSPDRCADYLGQLHELGRVVHIAGGEPMLYWDVLAAALELAGRRNLSPHFIETNCSFATGEAVVRERFGFFKRHGVFGVLLSCDPYHQQFVPPECFLLARRVAVEIFGAENVWASNASDEKVREYAAIAADEARLAEHVRGSPPMFTGRACTELARFVDPFPIDQVPRMRGWTGQEQPRHCPAEFDAAGIWEIHIDPYDNIQTNCGVILGRADRTPVGELMSKGLQNANLVAGILSREGPCGLAEFARRRHGFDVPERVRQKCELCYLTRRFLRPHYPQILGPAEIYQ
ncbi:MAG TPA: radical SAM protein [Phycisphaerae bacterium]|nr:radical SAM protein [Phycisphaerae bacterium]